jgi:purine-binding chemotaxis protein CheW
MESQKRRSSDQTERYLQFDLGKECYSIKLLNVKEVIPVPETTPLPNSPAYYFGIMNLRGQIISIVDLRKKLNIKPKEKDREEAVIIVDFKGVAIGVVVDAINRVLNLSIKDITEVPEVNSQVNAQYIQGVFKTNEKLTVLLDLEKVLNIQEILKYNTKAA